MICCLRAVGIQNRLETVSCSMLSHALSPKFRGTLGACTQFLAMGAKEKHARLPILPDSHFKEVFEV